MPSTNGNDGGQLHDVEKDKERDLERDKEKGSKNKQSSKAKDLSHVPCKFFKVGACTAGSSCPFSHNQQEPGAQKDVCTWFVKGNCKFGHKCALAHVLPGQSMSMDRKNKKAAQVAANGGKDGGRVRGQKRDAHSGTIPGGFSSVQGNQILLTGSTAPTRVLPPLKATISPSAPAPPLQTTDFASFGLPDESNKLPVAPAQRKGSQPDAEAASSDTSVVENAAIPKETKDPPVSPPLPLSTPSAPRRLGINQQRSPDFGPIGSPPRSMNSVNQITRPNGLTSGTPPSQGTGFVSSSPFSAPGAQTMFLTYDTDDSSGLKPRSGIAASLGADRAWSADLGPVPPLVTNRVELGSKAFREEVAVDDGDLEDFLPSSLTELLTPEEKSRRMSRSNSGQPMAPVKRDSSSQRPNLDGPHHRYSRSVPAPSLLGDIQSIWADNSADAITSTNIHPFAASRGLGSGTPSSYKSNPGFGNQLSNEDSFSPPLLSPTNASAAFLPGLHHHYLHSKTGAQRPTATNPLTAGTTPHPSTNSGVTTPLPANTFRPSGSTGMALSPPHSNALGNRSRFENDPSDVFASTSSRQVPGRPIPGGNGEFGGDVDERMNALSPSTRALQSHAPGQSLPQGLAAGYSRIHALPPPSIISSPSGSGIFSPSNNSAFPQPGASVSEWSANIGTGDYPSPLQGMGVTSSTAGLDSMFSRLSYAVTSSRTPAHASSATSSGGLPGNAQLASTVTAPGMVRNASGRSWQSQGPFSPLSGPVVTGDDDDLFSMDG